MIKKTDPAQDALKRAYRAVSAVALTAVRPIYRNVGTRLDPLGTVTFVEVDGIDYILTAAHVVDHHEAHSFYIGHRRFQDMTLTFRTTLAPGGDRSKDHWDFAFARADPRWREDGIIPLDISWLPRLSDELILTAVGYPISANRKSEHRARRIQATQRSYSSMRLPSDHPIHAALAIDHDTHVAVNRDPKYAVLAGRRVKTFEPRGMSGGIFFGLPDVQHAAVVIFEGEPTIFPAALIVEKSDKHRALAGPTLQVVADQIREQSAQ